MPTPFTDAGIARPTLSEDEKPGKLQPVASKILMKILFAARMARFDLLRATQSLASRVTKWSIECDVALHRLVSYIHCTKHHFLEGFIGDAFDECQLWLFADADHQLPVQHQIIVQTAEVLLKSRPKAVPASAPADDKGASSSQYRPQATARLEESVTGYVKAHWMEEHLPEYQYTMVTNSNGNEVPGILFNGTAYELELLTASDVETIASQVHVDKRFADFATRVNKVCRGHASCAKVPMDKDLWIDLEDFAKAFRKEVPPDVFITVSNLFGTAMKINKHGKSRFQFLCARMPDFPVDNGLGSNSCVHECLIFLSTMA